MGYGDKRDDIEGESMHPERDERDDGRRQQREEQDSSGDRRYPVQVRATFIRLDRSQQQASAA